MNGVDFATGERHLSLQFLQYYIYCRARIGYPCLRPIGNTKSRGTADGFSTELPERLHIDFTKLR